MVKSTRPAHRRKPGFPLWLHSGTGHWAKKLKGKVYYFGNDYDKAGVHQLLVGCAALASYREGKFDEAINWAQKRPDHKQHSGALALVVRTMAEHQLGQHDQSRQTLAEAEALNPRIPPHPGNFRHPASTSRPRRRNLRLLAHSRTPPPRS